MQKVIEWWFSLLVQRAMVSLMATLSLVAISRAEPLLQPLAQVDQENFPELYRAMDTCNAYVIKVGKRALLIDLGDAKVLPELPKLGIESVDWILFTHHHREQCQGIDAIDRMRTKVAAPQAEQELFEQPLNFRKWFPKLGDKYSVYGASYVRPPAKSIRLDLALTHEQVFTWEGLEILCLETPGHSPGSMTYVISRGTKKFAFSGDLMHDGAKMATWFDSEWDYGFAKGIDTLIDSVELMIKQQCDRLLPSHGPVIENTDQLVAYRESLKSFRASYVRGYPVYDMTNEQRDSLSRPTEVPLLNRVSPHMYKLANSTQGRNFAMIIADSGKALVLDCGLLPESQLDEIVVGARKHLGLKQIDAFWVSHMHGDHFLLGPAMKQKYGAEAWTLDRIADRCENPRNYDYAALVNAYDDGFDGMKIDRTFHDGESFEWEGYRIQIDWMPGQTEFGCCLWLEIDGKRVAFTGDNLFGNPADESQDGHEAVVARNSCIFQEGYLYGSEYLKRLNPDIVMGSHSFVMDQPAAFLNRYNEWAKRMVELYRGLLPDRDYEYLYDPYWVSAYPYRVSLNDDRPSNVAITIRNFRNTTQVHRILIKTPPGVRAEPNVIEGSVNPHARETIEIRLHMDRETIQPGVQMVPLDIQLDDTHYGEWFDFLIQIQADSKGIE
jgi:glyoxylase-like metal-dependent hydrolase (beta-lactamase superfamily II)